MIDWIEPVWSAPRCVRAVSTLRTGGVSGGDYASLNLGHHVGDDGECVRENRRRLQQGLSLPAEPIWLRQVHGIRVIDAAAADDRTADAAFARQPGLVCAVLTADCLPILLCSVDGECVAAVHAGWRGLAAGVVEAAVEALGTRNLLAWLGPAIGSDAFEVGGEVREIFLRQNEAFASSFRTAGSGKWFADIYSIARLQLAQLGITECSGEDLCTHSDAERFFSYRRDGQTGRMATLIWRE